MSKNELFSRNYDVESEMLIDFLQQAMASMPTVTWYELADSGDRIDFRTSFTLTSWGDNMVATVETGDDGRSALMVSGEPRAGLLSTPWGEEIHAATIETQLLSAIDPLVQVAKTNPIVMLQSDHRRVEALFARIQATEGDERAELVHQLLAALRVHMELEESLVYPLLEKEVDIEMAEEAEVEHQLARDGLAQLEELTPDEPGFDAALTMVMAGIEHHVMEEEADALPSLAQKLGPDRLAELADRLTAKKADLLQEQGKAGSGPSDEGRTTPKSEKASQKHPGRPPRPQRESGARSAPRSRLARAKVDPDQVTKADLVAQARKAGIGGYSHMSKAELAKALSKA